MTQGTDHQGWIHNTQKCQTCNIEQHYVIPESTQAVTMKKVAKQESQCHPQKLQKV